MVKYFVLIKRKGSKSWLGAIPAKKGVSLSKLRSSIRKSIRSGYSYRIVSETQLKKLLKKKLPKKRKTKSRRKRRKTRKRKTTRRKRVKRRKRKTKRTRRKRKK